MDLPIIKTLGDTDLYKLTMGHCVNQHFGTADVTYELTMRSDIDFTQEEVEMIKLSLKSMGQITFSDEEISYLRKRCGHYLPDYFFTFLRGYRLDPDQISVWSENNKLKCRGKGPWSTAIYWEIYVLATISEVFFKIRKPLSEKDLDLAYENAFRKAKKMAEMEVPFIDMGTRRRRSFAVHEAVIKGLIDGGKEFFLGTSNIHFAAKYNLTPYGTMAHEMFSGAAAMYGVENANNIVMGKWVDTYHGNLGIVLPDTFTTDFFLTTFGPFYAKLYDGARHDSGDPILWAIKMVNHYKKLGILPAGKKLVFSDGINNFVIIEKIKKICLELGIPFSLGIGTWLTNDFTDLPALNMVFKLIEAQKNLYELRRKAVKLSDNPGKHNGDPETVTDYKKRISI